MRRVIFVDDEPNVLRGLKRALRGMRHEWQMRFEDSGAAALEAMKSEPFDIVVSDMKMPGMDGADLLAEVRRLYPETVRIILSGHSEKEAILKCIGSVHQYLAKPCDPTELKSTIKRADALRALLRNESIKKLVSRTERVPSVPVLFRRIVVELQRPNVSLKSIGEIIALDPGMSAKVLQLVNSSFFGLRSSTSNVERAVTHLGLETISSLVLGVGVFSQYEEAKVPGLSMEALWGHSMLSAVLARAVARAEDLDTKAVEDAYLAGMLHDLGKLILAANVPERYGRVLERAGREELFLSDAEDKELGATHAEVGAYVIGLWGLADSVVEAVAFHARPLECPVTHFGVLGCVHVASGLAHEHDAPGSGHLSRTIDRDYLRELGLADRLPVWHEACRAFATQ